jgi:mannosyltransferase
MIKVREAWWVLGVFLISSVLRLANLGAQSLWFDETYTALVAGMPLRWGMKFLVADGVHPPLFYWIEKGVLLLGNSEVVLRLPAMIFGALGVVALYVVAREWLGQTRALLAALLLTLSPFHLWYSQDARMYTLLALFSIVCMWAYVRLLNQPNRWNALLFTLLSTPAYLTHYFALFLPLVQFVHLVTYLRRYPRELRIWSGLQFLAGLPLLGWVYLLAQRPAQYFGIGWIPQPSIRDLVYTWVNFTLGYLPPLNLGAWLLVASLLALAALGTLRLRTDRKLQLLLVLWAFAPLVVILLLSKNRPTYVDRFFILSLPPVLMLLATGIAGLSRRWGLLVGALALIAFAWRAGEVLRAPETLRKEAWREAVAYLSANVGPDEVIVLRTLQIAVPLQYYNPALPYQAMQVNREITLLEELAQDRDGVWLVYWNASAEAHELAALGQFDLSAEDDPITRMWLSGKGPELLEQRDFEGITLFHFTLATY